MRTFDIGDLVEWTVGNIKSKGIVRDDLGDDVEVVVYEINSKPTKIKLSVKKSCLN